MWSGNHPLTDDGGKTSEEALARLSPPAAAAAEDWPGKAPASDILR